MQGCSEASADKEMLFLERERNPRMQVNFYIGNILTIDRCLEKTHQSID
jgi:hypothetical protein